MCQITQKRKPIFISSNSKYSLYQLFNDVKKHETMVKNEKIILHF